MACEVSNEAFNEIWSELRFIVEVIERSELSAFVLNIDELLNADLDPDKSAEYSIEHVEYNTNLKRFFCSKCEYNLIRYQILKTFICMERSACHKMFFKRTKCQYFEHSPRASETFLDSFDGHSRTRDSC